MTYTRSLNCSGIAVRSAYAVTGQLDPTTQCFTQLDGIVPCCRISVLRNMEFLEKSGYTSLCRNELGLRKHDVIRNPVIHFASEQVVRPGG
jgi:hypothetical protein